MVKILNMEEIKLMETDQKGRQEWKVYKTIMGTIR